MVDAHCIRKQATDDNARSLRLGEPNGKTVVTRPDGAALVFVNVLLPLLSVGPLVAVHVTAVVLLLVVVDEAVGQLAFSLPFRRVVGEYLRIELLQISKIPFFFCQ